MSADTKLPATERTLSGLDFFLLWGGAAIALSEIWAGGLLTNLGWHLGVAAILLGHFIGNFPLALAGLIGSREGQPAILGMRPTLGARGAHVPAILNAIQLVGWCAVMFWIGGRAAGRLTGGSPAAIQGWTLAIGVVTTLWSLGGHKYWKWLQRVAVLLLGALSLGMTWLVVRTYGVIDLAATTPQPGASFMLGLDLVIAMPISWLPLVADYSRHARSDRSCFWGTWWGYFTASSWMYVTGLGAALATGSAEPEGMVLGLMQSCGWLLPALLIVALSTITTTFMDIYSNAMTLKALLPRASEKLLIIAGGGLGTALALGFPAGQYENFLLFIGSAFCPLFGVLLSDYFIVRRMGRASQDSPPPWLFKGVNLLALAAWAGGFVLYRASVKLAWPAGASVPAMLGAAALYLALVYAGSAWRKAGARRAG